MLIKHIQKISKQKVIKHNKHTFKTKKKNDANKTHIATM